MAKAKTKPLQGGKMEMIPLKKKVLSPLSLALNVAT
jgi:hypothetical protein